MKKSIPVLVVAGMVILFLMAMGRVAGTQSQPRSVLADEESYHAITTESEAINAALPLYPEGKSVTASAARLMTRYNAQVWYKVGATPVPGMYDPVRLNKPGWVVALIGPGLVSCDLGFAPCDNTAPVMGFYYIIDAQNGIPLQAGGLTDSLYSSLIAKTNESLVIEAATPRIAGSAVSATPPFAVVTSTPEP